MNLCAWMRAWMCVCVSLHVIMCGRSTVQVIVLSMHMEELQRVAARVGTYVAKVHSNNIGNPAKYMANVFDEARGSKPRDKDERPDGRLWRAMAKDTNQSGEMKYEDGWWWFGVPR